MNSHRGHPVGALILWHAERWACSCTRCEFTLLDLPSEVEAVARYQRHCCGADGLTRADLIQMERAADEAAHPWRRRYPYALGAAPAKSPRREQ